MTEIKKTYLGDGLYAHDDGWHIVLTAPREMGEHYVALEPEVIDSFLRFVEKARNVKITAVKNPEQKEL